MAEDVGYHTALKCPSCGSRTYSVNFVTQTPAYAEVNDGIIEHYGLQGFTDPISAQGSCNCGHKWYFRGRNINRVFSGD